VNYNQNGQDFLFLKSNYSYRTTLSLIYFYINIKITLREETEKPVLPYSQKYTN